MKLDIYGGRDTGRWFGHGEYEPGVDKPLEPCPFCGSREITIENTHSPYYAAECAGCGTVGPSGAAVGGIDAALPREDVEATHRRAFERAVNGWNGRA